MSDALPWSAEQRAWLEALGHPVERCVGPPPDPLLAAVLRAAGQDPDAPGSRRVAAGLPPLATLRGDGEAKRRLWPRLRAMRARA